MSEISVIGAGAWGTALAIILGRTKKHQVRLWAHEPAVRESLSKHRVNEMFFPGHTIPEGTSVPAKLADALEGTQIVVSVMPSQHCRATVEQMGPHLRSEMLFVSATKGLEEGTLMRMTEVISQTINSRRGFVPRVGALSGPSFAIEAAQGDPTAVTIASQDSELAEFVQQEFSDPRFRLYRNDDVIGVELGGALKNVIAIAAGVCDGLGFGHNSIAALISRGLSEMSRLAVACGGRQETMAGLAGLGDLVLTCTGGLSRNRNVGRELGQGRKLADIITGMRGMVAEGVFTTQAAVDLARKHSVEMPITEQMHAILYESKPPSDAIRELMSRSVKSESRLLSPSQQ
jgi:glycerol-3-phosphate dehydrogenase (NAD(P)+)